MEAFEQIIGHEMIKQYFKKSMMADKVSHSYIFEGPYGVGKRMMAKELAKTLLCESEQRPCGTCKNCKMVEAGTHPDISSVTKDTKVTKIDTVRDQVIKFMDIKPYVGKYKIVIVEEADTLNIEGQNAMLKTIEEPPSYGIVILVTKNLASLLPTIKSRCIHIRFSPLAGDHIRHYLSQHHIAQHEIEIYTQFCQGSIGKAQQLIEDEDFFALRKESISYLTQLEKANLMEMYQIVKAICDQKEHIVEILEFWELWYRDIAIAKNVNTDNFYYLDYKSQLLDIAHKLTYNKISSNIEQIRQARQALGQNVNTTLIIENLLLKLKERKK
ncbi:MAG: DNA polymerase III subunit delta' [Cellulosilyticaceae bacterium]